MIKVSSFSTSLDTKWPMEVSIKENSGSRIPALDFFRAAAVLLVVLFHYDKLVPFGFLGVDLFFVLSGYLVSRQYILAIKSGEKADWWSFIVKRATKILPSFFVFIIGGYFLAKILFLPEYPDQVLNVGEIPPYIFFYLNYIYSHAWSFKLVWSLCVEEHFYFFLTILVAIITVAFKRMYRPKFFLFSIWLTILIAFCLRLMEYRNGDMDLIGTHIRMDALMFGVLLAYQELIAGKIKSNAWPLFFTGLAIFISCSVCVVILDHPFVNKIVLCTFTPIACYLMIRGARHFSFGQFKVTKLFAYFSYNMYLWHPMISFFIIHVLEPDFYIGFPLYVAASAIVAIVMTKVVEEPGLLLRKFFIRN